MTQEDENTDEPAESGENLSLKEVHSVDFELDQVGDLVLYVSEAVLVDDDTGTEYNYMRVPPQRRVNVEEADEGDEE